ncbi:MAG: type III-B CRISPR module RAMP protein Cmr1 [Deltaproteobacteria bacterium]|nr:type III-B CRISPR module RAMP protein Cmr1 [Deltaproteobacteria bacterium]
MSHLKVAFKVVTPVLGGGVRVDETRRHHKPIDPRTPIRSSSIRGQLRFWWRCMCGHAFDSIEAMRAREAEIWGAASSPGAVSIDVIRQPESTSDVAVYELTPNKHDPQKKNIRPRPGFEAVAYGAFSLQTEQQLLNDPVRGAPGTLTRLEGECGLALSFPEVLRTDVERAIDAWLTFGGIGARTRRGFGAVTPTNRTIDIARLLRSAAPPRLALVPGLTPSCTFEVARGERPTEAQKHGLQRLKEFRQGDGVGRNPGAGKKSGRSRWPEPEAIRELTEKWDRAHLERFVRVDKFPRAAFGMPIIFHFQSNQDPRDTTLAPVGYERMASPLILRPVPREDGWACLGIILQVPDRSSVKLELKGAQLKSEVRAGLSPEEAARVKPMNQSAPGVTDPLEAFRRFVSPRG